MGCGELDSEGFFTIDSVLERCEFNEKLSESLGLSSSTLSFSEFRNLFTLPDGLKLAQALAGIEQKNGKSPIALSLTLQDETRRFLVKIDKISGKTVGAIHADPQVPGTVDFESILKWTRLLQSIEGVRVFLQIIADGVQKAINADRVVLITYSHEEVEHFVKAGPGRDMIVDVEYSELWDGLSGWVMRERKTAFSPRGADDPRESQAVRLRRQATSCGDIIVSPLIHSGMLFGTITAINLPDSPDFSEEVVGLTESMARMSAAAIFVARSFFNRSTEVDELYRLATHDELTGLFNRRMFCEMAKRAIANAERFGKTVAAVFFDLDGFKPVNDTYGHYYGDWLLKQVALRLGASMRQGETAARLGGDEFVVLFENIEDAADVEIAVHRLLENIRQPYLSGDLEMRVGASAGIAFFPFDAKDYDELMDRADKALYQAKREGKNRLRVFGSR